MTEPERKKDGQLLIPFEKQLQLAIQLKENKMIKKIQVTRSDNDLATKTLEAINKINEIIELLNAIIIDVDGTKCVDGSKKPEPADPYAEQRKWIGKICVFWDNDDTQEFSYGVLTKIDTGSGFGVQYCCNDEYDYDDCEPVKPDDDIIYKGE